MTQAIPAAGARPARAAEVPGRSDDPFARVPARFLRHGDRTVSANERRILATLWRAPDITRAELSAGLDLTQQSVHRLLAALAADGLVAIGPLVPPAWKGKPSPRLRLDAGYGCTFGISLDTDAVGVTCMDFAGRHVSRRLVGSGPSVDATLDLVDAVMDELSAEFGFGRDDVIGLGFAISGYLVEGTRYNPPDPLADWSGFDLAARVGERFGAAVWTENGANTAALCEAMFGAGGEFDDFVYVSYNYGLGAGIVVGGELLRGGHGNAGEVSGIFTAAEAAARPALGLLLDALIADGIDVRTIDDLAALAPNHPTVATWLERVAPQQSRLVNALAGTVDPEAIVLGGQISDELARALIECTEIYSVPRHGILRRMPTQRVSTLGTQTPAIGAACLPLKAVAF